MKYRKTLSAMGILSCCALVLSACGTGSQQGKSSTDESGNSIIEVWDYEGQGVSNDAMEAAVKAFEAKFPNTKIHRTSFAFGDLGKSIVQGGVGGKVPDVAVIDTVDNQNFAALGLLKDITAETSGMKDEFFEGPWSSTQLDGKTYGLPMNSNNLALFYNETLLKKAGFEAPPATWDELKSTSEKIAQEGISGIAISGVKNEQGTFQVLPFVWQTGGDLNNYDVAGGKALGFLKDLIDSGAMSSSVSNYSQEDARNQFVTEKSAMMINGPWELGNMKDIKFDWAVAPLPQGERAATGLGGENVVVFENSKNAENAVNFAKFMASYDGAKAFCDISGQLSSRPDLQGKLAFSGEPNMKVFENQMKDTHARAYGANYAKISELIQQSVQEALTGAKDPSAAAKSAFEQMKPLLP